VGGGQIAAHMGGGARGRRPGGGAHGQRSGGGARGWRPGGGTSGKHQGPSSVHGRCERVEAGAWPRLRAGGRGGGRLWEVGGVS
jgi:hypothetical protein